MANDYNIVPLPIPDDKKSELVGFLSDKFYYATQARLTQVDSKYTRWMNNYAGKPKEAQRTTPWPNSSNFMPQLIRMHTDILHARLFNVIMGTKPFWMPKTFIECPHVWLDQLGAWIEYESFYNMQLGDFVDKALLRSLKGGTVFGKLPWIQDEVFLGQQGAGAFKEVRRFTEGLCPEPIAFDDFYAYPITADNYDKIQIKFHKLRFDKEAINYRIAMGWWDKVASEGVLAGGEQRTEGQAKQAQATEAGVDLDPSNILPFKACEVWLRYPVTNDPTKYFPICVVFNPEKKDKSGYLRGYFNPSSMALDPFVPFTPMPRDELVYGYCLPEILEGAQEEQAQIHNWRRDASLIINSPMWKKRRNAGVPNPSQSIFPGKVFELDELDDLDVIQFSPTYNSMIEEESFLLNFVESEVGNGQPYQGMGAGTMDGKRGIYTSQGTMMMMAAGTNRLDTYLRRLRFAFNRLGNIIYYSNKDWRPNGAEFATFGQAGASVKRTFQFREPEGYRGLFFEIGASEAGANKEIDRNNLLLMANTLGSYYRQVIEMSQIVVQMPDGSPAKEIMLTVLDGVKDLTNRVLFSFDIGDRGRLVPDVRKVLAGGSQQADDAADQRGLTPPESPLGTPQLGDLAQRLAGLPPSLFGGPGGGA